MKPMFTSVILALALVVGASFAAQHESISEHIRNFDE
jgi:hypothetical protein